MPFMGPQEQIIPRTLVIFWFKDGVLMFKHRFCFFFRYVFVPKKDYNIEDLLAFSP